ncbi:MAG: hypothetical protein ACYS8L_00385 [Planctomycetota bacterium]
MNAKRLVSGITVVLCLSAAGWVRAGEPEELAAQLEREAEERADEVRRRAGEVEAEVDRLMREAEELEQGGSAQEREAEELRQRAEDLRQEVERARREGSRRHPSREAIVALTLAGAQQPTGVVVVPSGPMDEAEAREITEDLGIMSRILQKAVGEEVGGEYAILYAGRGPFSSLFDGHRRQALFLQGYGAVFVLNVEFPLAGRAEEEAEPPEPVPDSTWEETRREMHAPPGLPWYRERHEPPRPPGAGYDPGRVEGLQVALLEALRHASNIRALGADDSVALVVVGGASADAVRVSWRAPGNPPSGSHGRRRPAGSPSRAIMEGTLVTSDTMRTSGRTVLTIHVTKADVDALAEGELDLEEFRARATITTY